MPEITKELPPITDKSALYALIRFIISILALLALAISDLNHDKDSIPTIVYLLIGALNGVDVYNLIQKSRSIK